MGVSGLTVGPYPIGIFMQAVAGVALQLGTDVEELGIPQGTAAVEPRRAIRTTLEHILAMTGRDYGSL